MAHLWLYQAFIHFYVYFQLCQDFSSILKVLNWENPVSPAASRSVATRLVSHGVFCLLPQRRGKPHLRAEQRQRPAGAGQGRADPPRHPEDHVLRLRGRFWSDRWAAETWSEPDAVASLWATARSSVSEVLCFSATEYYGHFREGKE